MLPKRTLIALCPQRAEDDMCPEGIDSRFDPYATFASADEKCRTWTDQPESRLVVTSRIALRSIRYRLSIIQVAARKRRHQARPSCLHDADSSARHLPPAL